MAASTATRRNALAMGAGALLVPALAAAKSGEKEVGAVEDLMREHGVLRRALLVYIESVPKLRQDPARFDAAALSATARLFRRFGEDYHERKLEEEHIFPELKKSGGPAAAYVDVLLDQHHRGREITDYIVTVTRAGKVKPGDGEALAGVLSGFVLMYQNHAAREDTIVFPAWKNSLSEARLKELGDQFESIEKQEFGGDGFEQAVRQIGEIETQLGFANLARFTPLAPPRA